MIDYTQLKADIEDGSINEHNLICSIGKQGVFVSILKWLSDVAASVLTLATNTPATTQRTATTTLAVADGSSAAGAYSVIFGVSSDFSGTIDGIAVDPTEFASVPYVAPQGDTLDAIAYTVAAGSLLIVRIA